MRISDWSSDVCSSDLFDRLAARAEPLVERLWQSELAALPVSTPEQRAGLQARLRALARSVEDADVRQAYAPNFRERFYQHFRTPNRFPPGNRPSPPPPRVAARTPPDKPARAP